MASNSPQSSKSSGAKRWVLLIVFGIPILLFVYVTASIGRAVLFEGKSGTNCVKTELTPQNVVVQDPLQPLKLRATLLADGKPLAGGKVTFGTRGTMTHQSGRTFDSGRHIGEATTNSEGVAEFVRKEGLDGLTLSNETLTGYSVSFTPLTPINDVHYCFDRNKKAELKIIPASQP